MSGWDQRGDIEDWERLRDETPGSWPVGAVIILLVGLGMLAVAVLLQVFG